MTSQPAPASLTDAHLTQLDEWLGPHLAAHLTTAEQQKAAWQIMRQLVEHESLNIARAWMIGMNPHLNDCAPILAIANERASEVEAAARAYLDGVWS